MDLARRLPSRLAAQSLGRPDTPPRRVGSRWSGERRPDFLEATKAEDEARVRLPENLRNILDETGCSSPDEEEMPFP